MGGSAAMLAEGVSANCVVALIADYQLERWRISSLKAGIHFVVHFGAVLCRSSDKPAIRSAEITDKVWDEVHRQSVET